MHKSLIRRSLPPAWNSSHLAAEEGLSNANQSPFPCPDSAPWNLYLNLMLILCQAADMPPRPSEKKNKYLTRNSKLIAKCCQNTSETHTLIGSIIHLCIRIVNTYDMPEENMDGSGLEVVWLDIQDTQDRKETLVFALSGWQLVDLHLFFYRSQNKEEQ